MHILRRGSVGLLVSGTALPLFTMLHSARADFEAVESEWRTDVPICSDTNNPYIDEPLAVCNIYAVFDENPSQLLAVGGCEIQVFNDDDVDVFYQHPFGFDTPYLCDSEAEFPEIVCDSYVAFGWRCGPVGLPDGTTPDPDFDTNAFNNNGHVVGGWFAPSGGPTTQGFSGQYHEGRVLVAQFAVAEGLDVSGIADIFWRDVDTGDTHAESGLPVECLAVDLCPADLDGDGSVSAADLAMLLGSWGPCPGCPADFDGDGSVSAADLAQLLGAWGDCP